MDIIRQNLPNLEIGQARGIEEHARTATFSKIYASDAISLRYTNVNIRTQLISVLGGLKIHGLLYISNGDEIDRLVPNTLNLGIQVETELTARARAAEMLHKPTIYRKF